MHLLEGLKVAAICCLSTVCLQSIGQEARTSQQGVIPINKRVAAPDFVLQDVQGRPLSLSEFKGKVVLLDFWAISCGGCKLELPWYVGYANHYGREGLALIGLDMYGEKPQAIRAFAAAHQMTYPLAVGTDEIGGKYHLGEMPLTVLVDRRGQLAVSHVGVVDPKVFEADIRELLAER